ncbi:hypothetical protein RDI58_010561 [Solanum bulbocastanum]|uniref:Uncharacterized protein n=1 Tax=Solanum bulbocastanum TaxID=147425 RepID=A0AAN8TPI7_SOLBU
MSQKKFSIPICGEEFVKKPSHIPRDQWNPLLLYWLSEKAKKHSQANKISRATQTGGSKSIATLMNEQAIDGIEPTRAKVYILIHTKRRNGRPLDEESSNVINMMNEKMSNDETQEDESNGSYAWKGVVYSQVLRNEKSRYVRGLGLGPTPSLLWGSISFLRNVGVDSLCNEAALKLEQEINELNKK